MLYVCVRDVMDVVFSICIVTRGAVGARMTLLSCRCIFVYCVHPVAVLNAVFCMACSYISAGRGCKRRPYGRGIPQSWYHDCLILGSHEYLLQLTPSCC